jgi:hypothetical protein
MAKVFYVLSAAFVITVVAARLAFEFTAPGNSGPVNEPWALSKMEFISWNNEEWTAWIHDGEFAQTPQNTGDWHRHSNPSLAFIDWEGEPWQAKVGDEAFLLAHRGNWDGLTENATAIRYRDWAGRRQLRTLSQLSR